MTLARVHPERRSLPFPDDGDIVNNNGAHLGNLGARRRELFSRCNRRNRHQNPRARNRQLGALPGGWIDREPHLPFFIHTLDVLRVAQDESRAHVIV